MALISKKFEDTKEKIKVELPSSLISEIDQYMQWAELSDLSYFIEESVLHVFSSDKEWKKHKKSLNKIKEKTEG